MFGGFVFEAVEDILDDNSEVVVSFFLERDLIEVKCALVDAVELVLAALGLSEVFDDFEGVLHLDLVDLDGGVVEIVDIGTESLRKGQVGGEEAVASR